MHYKLTQPDHHLCGELYVSLPVCKKPSTVQELIKPITIHYNSVLLYCFAGVGFTFYGHVTWHLKCQCKSSQPIRLIDYCRKPMSCLLAYLGVLTTGPSLKYWLTGHGNKAIWQENTTTNCRGSQNNEIYAKSPVKTSINCEWWESTMWVRKFADNWQYLLMIW